MGKHVKSVLRRERANLPSSGPLRGRLSQTLKLTRQRIERLLSPISQDRFRSNADIGKCALTVGHGPKADLRYDL